MTELNQTSYQMLLTKVRACQCCTNKIPHTPRPIIQASSTARLIIIGQAPGSKVQQSGIPWDDPSGKRLRKWLHVDEATFYDATRIALIPMGFCYPGKGKSGDLPPRPECAPLWHETLLNGLPENRLTLLIGQYAQKYYLGHAFQKNLTETVKSHHLFSPEYIPLSHPSPRNFHWLAKNPWFEKELIPQLQSQVASLLKSSD